MTRRQQPSKSARIENKTTAKAAQEATGRQTLEAAAFIASLKKEKPGRRASTKSVDGGRRGIRSIQEQERPNAKETEKTNRALKKRPGLCSGFTAKIFGGP